MSPASHIHNPHLTDPNVLPFLSPSFSPVEYLNSAFPSSAAAKKEYPPPSLSAIASQTQSQVSALNTLNSRLSTTLTSLTDDILRTSSRLAYEVELLRGEALSLADSLSSRGDLQNYILRFVPGGLDSQPQSIIEAPAQGGLEDDGRSEDPGNFLREPEALPHLRTLLHVRAQLQTVIQRFNLALSFQMPPSLITTATSSILSVNPPNQDPDLDRKGQSALQRFKQEVLDLLTDSDGRGGGVERAKERISELREVCAIWKGTGEERARVKWVDGLEEMVDDEVRKKEVKAKGGGASPEVRRDTNMIKGAVESSGSGPGFLRRLREEIYME